MLAAADMWMSAAQEERVKSPAMTQMKKNTSIIFFVIEIASFVCAIWNLYLS